MENESRNPLEEKPCERLCVGVVQKSRNRWLIVLDCGHTINLFTTSILKMPKVFYCPSCSYSKDMDK